MRLTAVICTWNRASLLRQTLDSMTKLVVPDGMEWELIVVDNNCTDDTEQVLEAFAGSLPIRPVREPRPGKSNALNRAVDEASGDYIVHTDDDVIVESDWLRAYARAFRAHPDGSVFGGPILPWFEGEPPEWLVEAFPQVEFAFAALDLGTAPVRLRGRQSPFGANMALRTEEQRSLRYDPDLGPRPGSGLRGEEVALVQRLFQRGAEGYWVPEARVHHYIPRDRQTVAHLREWYRGWGEFLVRERPGEPTHEFLGRPRWLWREVVEAQVRYRVARVLASPSTWVEELKKLSIAQGRFSALGGTR